MISAIRIPKSLNSSPITQPMKRVRLSLSTWLLKGLARTSAVHRSKILTYVPAKIGVAASSVHATARNSTWQDVSPKVFRHQRTCGFRRTGLSGMT